MGEYREIINPARNAQLNESEALGDEMRGEPEHVGQIVRRFMAELAKRRIDPEYLEERHGG